MNNTLKANQANRRRWERRMKFARAEWRKALQQERLLRGKKPRAERQEAFAA
jgi:hypothetical protein